MKRLTVAALVALCATTLVWASDGAVTGVEARKTVNGYEIAVLGTGLERPKILRTESGNNYILDFSAHLEGKKQSLDIGVSGVKQVQLTGAYPDAGHVRITVKLESGVEPQLISRDGQWIVLIGGGLVATNAFPGPAPLDPMLEGKLTPSGPGMASPVMLNPDESLRLPAINGQEQLNLQNAQKVAKGTRPPTVAQPDPPKPKVLPDKQISKNSDSHWSPGLPKGPVEEVISAHAMALGSVPVSLDFVNTDVAQVLKALAMQTGQNIILAADVSPAGKPNLITVDLHNVSLEQALNNVTAMANLRYAKVDSVYVVAGDQNFAEVVRKLLNKSTATMEYRVVNLNSGEADMIRESTLRALPPDGLSGFYEIIQTDDKRAAVSGTAAGGDPTKVGDPTAPAVPTPAQSSRANYLMLVGEGSRLDLVEKYVRDLDKKLSDATANEDVGSVVISVQSGESTQVKESLLRYLQNNPRADQFMIRESDAGDNGKITGAKVLSILGPRAYLAGLESLARELDRGYSTAKGISYVDMAQGVTVKDEVINLRHVDPVIMLARIKERFPNVRAWTLPDPVTPMGSASAPSGSSTSATGPLASGGSSSGGMSGAPPASTGGSPAPTAGSSPTGGSTSGSSAETGLEPMRILVQGAPSVIQEVRDYIALVDIEPPTIALELRVLELSKEDSAQFGLDLNFLNAAGGSIFRFNQGTGAAAATPGNFGGQFGMKDGNALSFLATLDSLRNGSKLIARPNALIEDGRSAEIFVGDTIRYITNIQSTQSGTTVTTDSLKVGVNFDIRARVSPEGQINLNLSALFNILKGFTAVPGGGSLPQTADRSFTQPVSMYDGETIAIGGLITDQDRKSYSGIPILKDLPLIGQLFGRTDNDHTRTEIVFFVTAKVVNRDNRANAASPRANWMQHPDPVGDYNKGAMGNATTGPVIKHN